MKKLFAALLFIVFATSTYAQKPGSSLCTSGYSIYFGNGIRTELTAAHFDAEIVKGMLGNQYDNEPVKVYVSYNPTSGILRDLRDSFAQKRAADPTLSWQLFFRWVSGSFINSSLQVALDDYFDTTGSRKLAQTVATLSGPQAYTDPTVIGHVGTYMSALLAGKHVLVVSHSQGNLYANAAYRLLQTRNSGSYDLGAFGIAGVASPADSVATGDGYVTSDTDHIIDAVRLIAPATLPSNDNSVPFTTSADRLGHSFSNIYTNARFNIRNHVQIVMESTLATIATVTPTPASGPITATLTWSTPGDVDLHTYEPYAHVYYAHRSGNVGYLDRDDTTGTGPEHYYASCQDFQVGNYDFGVNYYAGSDTKQATVKLSVLGVDYPARTLTVTTPRGSAGNDSPTILYHVQIQDDGHGEYMANVQ